MFDPKKRRIASKAHVWERIRRGELMTLTLDLETGGLNRQDVPYATPGYPFITEYGDCLTDMAGNYLNSAQVFPRRPEWLMFQPSAPILQRLKERPELYDSEDRMPYIQAMAALVWRIEQAAYAYSDFGDEKISVPFRDYNKQFKHGMKEGVEEVVPIPLRLENGEVVCDVRYHPERRKIAYRFDRDPASPYYEANDNLYYEDADTGAEWKWVDARIAIDFFNGFSYDLPVLRTNLYRAGFDPVDTTFLYTRATATNKQRPKNHATDVRSLIFANAVYGRQTEDGIKFAQMLDPATGKLRTTEALAAFLEQNARHANPIRLIRGGAFMPDDGSKHDSSMDHGAAYDAMGTAAARNLCWDTNPELCALLDRQADEKSLIRFLTAQSPAGDKLPLFSLPRRQGGLSHAEAPYWFMGTDDQIGRFKRLLFLLADGQFHKRMYSGKPYKDLSVQDWQEVIRATVRDPDRPVRVENMRRFPGAIPVEDVYQKTAQAARYRDNTEDMLRDCEYILQNPEMRENILTAIEEMNRQARFTQKHPHNELMEDELPRQYSGEINFMEDEIARERRRLSDEARRNGGGAVAGVLETVKGGMDNVYKSYMRQIDGSMRRLCLRAHPIDLYDKHDFEDPIHEKDKDAAEVMANFADLCERVYAKVQQKKWPYIGILDHLKSPVTGEPYFNKGKFQAATVRDAFEFRKLLALRALEDYEALLMGQNSDFAARYIVNGHVDKDFCQQKAGKRSLLLFADPDNGEKGAAPHIVDEAGRELDLGYIKAQAPQDILTMIDKGKWNYRFYRLRSEPTIVRLAQRFVDLGLRAEIPARVYKLYEADRQRRLYGMDSENETTDRVPTDRTFEFDLKRLELSATTREPHLLERDAHPVLGEASKLVKYEEGQRILTNCRAWLNAHREKVPYRHDLIPATLHDPASGMPYDYIPYEINRRASKRFEEDPNFIVMDVPAWHLRYPVEQFDTRLPHKCLAVPQIGAADAEAVKRGKPVILREIETGRLYHCGPASVHEMPRIMDSSMRTLTEKVHNDYRLAGRDLAENAALSILGIEGIYPLANTRDVDASHQSLMVPSLHFDGLVYPQFASLGDARLTTVIVPVDYCPQELAPGKRLRLREMAAKMFANIDGKTGQDTGHMYETVLRHVMGADENGQKVGITLEEFNRRARSGDIPPEIVAGAGFAGPDHIDARLREWATKKWKDDPMRQRVLIAVFDEVNKAYFRAKRWKEAKNDWAYFNPPEAPTAALKRDGGPIPPSAYRG